MLKNLTLFHLLLLATSLAFSGPVVPSGSILLPGQAAIASNSKYFASMQSDGNFVMYRTADSAVRFATYQFGAYLAMQGDGNLVEYGSNQLPLWNTATNNNPGAFLVVQDDGNLVVYNAASKPLWNIGPDPGLDAPVNVGDVPARDLAYPVVGLLGHIGVWTGSKIAEMAAGSTIVRTTPAATT